MKYPNPPDTIPDFLFEELTDLSPGTLRDVSEYARGERPVAPDSAPESLVTAFALQDDETLEEIAEYAESLAALLEEYDAESLAASIEDQSTDEGDQAEEEEKTWGQKQVTQWYS